MNSGRNKKNAGGMLVGTEVRCVFDVFLVNPLHRDIVARQRQNSAPALRVRPETASISAPAGDRQHRYQYSRASIFSARSAVHENRDRLNNKGAPAAAFPAHGDIREPAGQ